MLVIPAWVKSNREWRSALYVLDSPLLAAKGCRKYVNFETQEIDFPRLFEKAKPWSTSELLMARLAADLYNSYGNLSLADALSVLDNDNLRVMLNAIALRRSVPLVSDLRAKQYAV